INDITVSSPAKASHVFVSQPCLLPWLPQSAVKVVVVRSQWETISGPDEEFNAITDFRELQFKDMGSEMQRMDQHESSSQERFKNRVSASVGPPTSAFRGQTKDPLLKNVNNESATARYGLRRFPRPLA
ncbi:hypothetical protein J6590_027888, partial [Homalodisca vitripennis]